MTTIPTPGDLLGEFDSLVQRAEAIRVALDQALQDAERRSRSLTDTEIDSLSTLASALERLRRAKANGNGAGSAAAVEALHAWLGQSAQLVTPLRDRFAALDMTAPAVPVDAPGQPVAPPPTGVGGASVQPVAPLPTGVGGAPAQPVTPPQAAADPRSRRTFRLADPPLTGPDVAHFQRLLSFRYKCWHASRVVAETGVYDAETRRAAWDVARRLGIADEDLQQGFTPELRRLIRQPERRTAEQQARAKRRRKKRKPEQGKAASAEAPATKGGIGAAINAAGGRYGEIIAREAARHALSPALVCAVVEQESTFRNVFGHDKVRNPIKGGDVTEARYKQYLAHRKAGEGMNGVGPMQLTWHTLQDQADSLGGCWKVAPNIRVGCEHLAKLIRTHGKQAGIQAYNGAPGLHYSNSVLAREAKWAQKLAGAKPSPITTKPDPAIGKPRTFKVRPKEMQGEDIRRFQGVLNERFEAWGVDIHVPEDGEYGKKTRHAAIQVARGLGIAPGDYAHGITPAVRTIIRNPKRRTAAQLELAKANRAWLQALRKRHGRGSGSLGERAWREARRMNDLGIREVGNNGGQWVTKIIHANDGVAGEHWCGDFVAWCYRKAGSKSVNRKWAVVRWYLPLTGLKATKAPRKGDIVRFTWDHVGLFGYWCDAQGREVSTQAASHFRTIEGNTGPNAGGTQGVHMKIHRRSEARDFIHVNR